MLNVRLRARWYTRSNNINETYIHRPYVYSKKNRGCIIIENVRYRWSPSGKRGINTVRSKEGTGAETGLLASLTRPRKSMPIYVEGRKKGIECTLHEKQPARDLRLVNVENRMF